MRYNKFKHVEAQGKENNITEEDRRYTVAARA